MDFFFDLFLINLNCPTTVLSRGLTIRLEVGLCFDLFCSFKMTIFGRSILILTKTVDSLNLPVGFLFARGFFKII